MLRNPFRNLDNKKLSHSSDILKTQNDYFKIVNRRILIFLIIIAILFSTISMRLAFIQIYDQENYVTKLENYSSLKQRDATSRGEIYDRNGLVIARTVSSHNITYFPPKEAGKDEQWALANKFAKQFNVTSEQMGESDYQDLYIFLHKNKKGELDGGKDLLKANELNFTMERQENIIRSRITKVMVDNIADETTKSAFSVYLAMRKLPDNQSKVIIEDAKDEDVAFLTENKGEFRGFDIDLGSWKREYPYGNVFRDVLGNITSSKQGIPSELRDYYEAKGYPLTSRVGKSGLEQQYEELLSGSPRVSDISYDKDGIAVLKEVQNGKNGYDLHLSIDIDLQIKLDQILENVLARNAGIKGREKFNKAIVVLMDPNSGEVYAMSGKYIDDNKVIQNYSSAAYLDSYQSGSVVKGATVYMMLEEGIQTRNSIINDTPMKIAGTGVKASFQPWGIVNAVRALEVSSNIYMFQSAIRLAGGRYEYDKSLNISNENIVKTLRLMRNYYSKFGLGTKTRIDIPNEVSGFKDFSTLGGRLLDFSIGQYDSYTPLQLAQYASVIASNGKKAQPKLVNYANEVNTNYKIFQNNTNITAMLQGKPDSLQVVKEGFRACVSGGHCGTVRSLPQSVAAKTGTAEVGNYTNASLIGFAPYDDTDPKVSFACSAPTSGSNDQRVELNICSSQIMADVLKEFFKKY